MTFRFSSDRFTWVAIAAALLLVVLLTGAWIRESIDRELRLALCLTGAGLFGVATIGYIVSPAHPFGISASTWVKALGSAALVGFLLFILFVQGVECELRSSGRGISTVCRDVES